GELGGTAADLADEPADSQTHRGAAGAGDEQLERREAGGEGTGHHGGHPDPVGHQGGGVVDQSFAFQEGHDPPRGAEPPHDGDGRHRVGGRDNGAEHEGGGPGDLGDERVGHGGNGADGQQHHNRAVPGDGPELRPEVAQRGGERGQVEQRRDEEEEERLRLQHDAGKAGDGGEGQAAEHEEDRVREVEPAGEDAEGGGDGQQDDGELQALHGAPRWGAD